ncbi:UNVERIFIED_CONTAM: hypothetical protein K2H54_018820 [Gekko kuhli]
MPVVIQGSPLCTDACRCYGVAVINVGFEHSLVILGSLFCTDACRCYSKVVTSVGFLHPPGLECAAREDQTSASHPHNKRKSRKQSKVKATAVREKTVFRL